jgi:DNA-binding winged helix-turn-helix (wHTH) protein/tetratricopeptide (TPR) repeat protein
MMRPHFCRFRMACHGKFWYRIRPRKVRGARTYEEPLPGCTSGWRIAVIQFPPFRLDADNEQLWRNEHPVRLRRRVFAVLRYLAERPGQLVRTGELFAAVWPDTYVSQVVVKGCIAELRRALKDSPAQPRIIETVHGRGYRFIAARPDVTPPGIGPIFAPAPAPATSTVVGRETEIARLDSWLESARAGRRQMVFVHGEIGIGKTTLLEAFLAHCAATGSRIARGQCIEQYGPTEAFAPVLDALGRLCRQPGGEAAIAALRRHAPAWLLELTGLASLEERQTLRHEAVGIAPERMLRMISEALEAIAAAEPLILVLEDLHWSDHATVDFLSYLAHRDEPARLLIIGSYRPTALIIDDHPLRRAKADLQLRRRCVELGLDCLSAEATEAYVASRFPGTEFPASFSSWLYEQTEGNPLFLVNIVDYLIARAYLHVVDGQFRLRPGFEHVEVPDTLRQLVDQEIEGLPPEAQRILEAASVAGMEVSAAAVAAALSIDVEPVESWCHTLTRRGQFLRDFGTVAWPDGTLASRCRFIHSLYRDVVYRRIAPNQRQQFHRRIGTRLQSAYGAQAATLAAELAVHFEQGGDQERALHYLKQAADTAVRRSAHQEAVAALTKALALLPDHGGDAEQVQQELALQMQLASSLVAMNGNAHPQVKRTFTVARTLADQLGEAPQLLPTLWGLWAHHVETAEHPVALALAERSLQLAARGTDPLALARSHRAMAWSHFWSGNLREAREHSDRSLQLVDADTYAANVAIFGPDTGGLHAAWIAWYLGYPDQAKARALEGLDRARRLFYLRHEVEMVHELATETVRFCTHYGIAPWKATGTLLCAWALIEQGHAEAGLRDLAASSAALEKLGFSGGASLRTIGAEVEIATGQPVAAFATLQSMLASAEQACERVHIAELLRLMGEAQRRMIKRGPASRQQHTVREAEALFQRALKTARQQGARALELRAATSMARLWQEQGNIGAARRVLGDIFGWFSEGFDTPDLQHAAQLLRALG